jgi:hypothetical protein
MLREGHRFQVYKNMVVGRMFKHNREEGIQVGENCSDGLHNMKP